MGDAGTVKLSVNLLAGGKYWVVGAEVPEELVPEHSRRHVLPDSPSGVVGSGRATEPDEDVPAPVVHRGTAGQERKPGTKRKACRTNGASVWRDSSSAHKETSECYPQAAAASRESKDTRKKTLDPSPATWAALPDHRLSKASWLQTLRYQGRSGANTKISLKSPEGSDASRS